MRRNLERSRTVSPRTGSDAAPARGGRRRRTAALALVTAVTVLTGCGSGGSSDEHGAQQAPAEKPRHEPSEAPTTEPPTEDPEPQNPAPREPAPEHFTSPPTEWDPEPESIAAVGDSITRGFDACDVLVDCPEVSWSTGTDKNVRSLAQRLLTSPEGRSWNYARSGALMKELPDQLEKVVPHRPQLVTVTMGSNDACQKSTSRMTSVDDFRASFSSALKSLRKSLPGTEVYVASVPDLKRLWSEGRADPVGKQIWQLGICQSILKDPDATDRASAERRQEVSDRVVAYNEVLESVCAEDRLCRYDDGAVHAYRFTGRQLSTWDWFHPNKDGQHRLAEIAYQRITAPS
ncbi:SGNH/GDSL hydrolase family protein [Streptomyces sp. TP-A0874]|uniref:SGNH/GDSL hydrolase family protein n=1 Tax=Streptomyces sp. TP-A0874 TaxID=549819 RepID=UPI0008539D0F|nr:SGNH/GDSL hydrolase family protein [Streptomyces sp. TP-A0874]